MKARAQSSSRRSPAVCAVIVTHNPDGGWPERLASVRAEVSAVVVVDNASRALPPIPARSRVLAPVVLLRNRRNTGIATALNQGFHWARLHRFAWVLTLDHDSQPQLGMTAALQTAISRHPAGDRIALAAPRGIDPAASYEMRFLQPDGPFGFRYRPCRGELLEGVSFVNNSGCLHRASVHKAIHGFRDELFLDYVDVDYCLRARRAGYEILVVCGASVVHPVGRRRERRLGSRSHFPTFHEPKRWYYINRNRMAMWRQHAWRAPHWAAYDAFAACYSLFRMLAFEDRRGQKLWMSLRGFWHGVQGRSGPDPAAAR